MILVILVLNIDLGPRVCMEPNKMETVKRKSGWRRGIFPRFQMDRIFRHVFYLSVCVLLVSFLVPISGLGFHPLTDFVGFSLEFNPY